jgi:ATP-dependent helicase/nuclease subunit B
LKQGTEFKAEEISTGQSAKDYMSTAELAEEAYTKLEAHIRTYQNPEQGYLSRYAPASARELSGDYDHLARVREWSLGETDSGDGEE